MCSAKNNMHAVSCWGMCYSTHTLSKELSHGTILKKLKIYLKLCAFPDSATIGLCSLALKVHCYFRLCPDLKKTEDDIKLNEKEKNHPSMKVNWKTANYR